MPSRHTPPAYEHHGQRIGADAFYAIACDPHRSVAVEACAGAGKTWMLVSRIVRALLDGVDASTGALRVQPHEILAITFTKRAAGEMRERLYQWLEDFAHADQPTLLAELRARGLVIENTPQRMSAAAQQLSNLYRSVLASGRQVQVRTFHSWFAAILRSAPLALLQQLELPVNYVLLEEDAQAKALVWRRFYSALVAEGAASLQADFEALVFAYGRSQTEKALQTALDKRTEFALADAQGIVDTSVQPFADQYPEFAHLPAPDDFLQAEGAHLQTLWDAARALGRASAKTFSAKGAELEAALTAGDGPGACAALLTKEGTARKFGEKLAGIERVRAAQDLVLQVQAARRQHEAWLYQQRMARLTRLLIREYGALKRQEGWVDMNDVERAASHMLSDSVLAGWVQERLDARIKHLLIDEFQDTNPLQWQALRAWLSGYAGAGAAAPSVFIVGDPKQSIYRFRRAEPQVFRAAKEFVRDALGGDLLSCDHTRRNATGVIACVNAVMAQAVQEDGYEGFRPHSTSSAQEGAVVQLPPIPRPDRADGSGAGAPDGMEVSAVWRDSLTTPRELPEETLRTLEARQAAHWIAAQLGAPSGGLQPSDCMVLARKRAALEPLALELRQLRIPAQIGEKTDLIDCCEVQDVVALLDVLVSPQHDLSLARVLKSPIFGLGDEALVTLALARQADAEAQPSWFDLLQKTELLAPDGRAVGPVLCRWKTWLDQLPPHDALQAIYDDGDVLARFAAQAPATQVDAVLANLRAVLAAALEIDGGRYATPYALVRALKSGGVRAPAAADPQALRLLTVHGAKGLEAQVVVLLDTDSPERPADTMGVLVDWPGQDAWPRKFVFLTSESQPPACAGALLQAEQVERQREELNALYVALTRARHTLVVSSIAPHRSAGRSWRQRLADLAQVLPVPAQASAVASQPAARDVVVYLKELPQLPVLPETASAHANQADTAIKNVVKAEPDGPPSDADSASAQLGQAMHRLLEWGQVSHANVQAAAREFQLNAEQARQAAAMATNILQGEGAWAWDPSVLAWQGNEVELMVEGAVRRLDRLVQRRDGAHAGHWWVLDYKSAHAPQHHSALVAQLRQYQRAVQAIYPGDVVKAAFLTPQGKVLELEGT